jgi:hypothetical protein
VFNKNNNIIKDKKKLINITITLAFKQPTFAYANPYKKPPHEIHFIYLGNKEIYCTLRHAA